MLSNNADKLLEYLLSLPSSDGHVYAETPTDITRSDTCYELQQKGYIDRYQAFGHSGFSCILTYMAKEYSKNKGMYQYMEAKNMFTPLSKSSRAFFLELVDNRDKLSQYLDTLYSGVSDEKETELNQKFGYLKDKGLIDIVYGDDKVYHIVFTYAGNHYFELEEEYIMQNEKRQSNSYENVGLIIQGDNNTVSGNMVSVNKNLLELDDIVKTIKQTLRDSDIEDESREIINDNVDVIHEQLKNNNPKKGFIKTAISGLQGIYPKIEDSVKLASSIMAIIKLAKDLEIL